MNICVESYGCSNSQAEAEMISGLLKQSGYDIVNDSNLADLSIVVTCYVKKPTEQKMLFRIGELARSRKIIIAGCMPEGMRDRLVAQFPSAGLLSTHQIGKAVEAVEKTLKGERVEYVGVSSDAKLCIPRVRINPFIGIVPMSSGCNSSCSYCCVRLAKGKLISYPQELITKDIELSIKEGCKEIWLTAQDTASYGLDKSCACLPGLLDKISGINGDFTIRVGMMNPRNAIPIKNNLIDSFRSDKIYKFFHIPVQSGSDSVLSSMNRGYCMADVKELVDYIRKTFRCQIWTDMIVGYPTENDHDFSETLKAIESLRPDWTNISKFGKRPGTEAAMLKTLPPEKVNERSRQLSELARKISLERNRDWIGWKGNVLITDCLGGNKWAGRNFAYKHVLVESNENLAGRSIVVKIFGASYPYIKGELVNV